MSDNSFSYSGEETNTTEIDPENVIKLLDIVPDENQLVCPFRQIIVTFKQIDDSVVQQTYYPQCYYKKCPYYDVKENSCFRSYYES